MNCKIDYDFALSSEISLELKNISEELKSFCLDSDELSLYSQACNIDSSKALLKKLELIANRYKKICNDIVIQSEEIEKVSKQIFLIEEAAVKITESSQNK